MKKKTNKLTLIDFGISLGNDKVFSNLNLVLDTSRPYYDYEIYPPEITCANYIYRIVDHAKIKTLFLNKSLTPEEIKNIKTALNMEVPAIISEIFSEDSWFPTNKYFIDILKNDRQRQQQQRGDMLQQFSHFTKLISDAFIQTATPSHEEVLEYILQYTANKAITALAAEAAANEAVVAATASKDAAAIGSNERAKAALALTTAHAKLQTSKLKALEAAADAKAAADATGQFNYNSAMYHQLFWRIWYQNTMQDIFYTLMKQYGSLRCDEYSCGYILYYIWRFIKFPNDEIKKNLSLELKQLQKLSPFNFKNIPTDLTNLTFINKLSMVYTIQPPMGLQPFIDVLELPDAPIVGAGVFALLATIPGRPASARARSRAAARRDTPVFSATSATRTTSVSLPEVGKSGVYLAQNRGVPPSNKITIIEGSQEDDIKYIQAFKKNLRSTYSIDARGLKKGV